MTGTGEQPDDGAELGGLAAELTSGGNESVIRLTGEFDMSAAEEFRSLGATALGRPGVTTLVVDMSGVEFMDSSALGALIEVREAAAAQGVDTALRGVQSRVLRVFEITGVGALFGLPTDEDRGP